MMPKIDGFSLIKLLSEENTTSTIPVILLTAKVSSEDVRRGMNFGADDYLLKPFRIDELLNSVQTRLKKKEKLDIKLDQLKDDLSAKLPHELRTPLVPILGYSEMISAESDLDSIQSMAKMIAKSGGILRDKIEKFLLYKDLILLEKKSFANNRLTLIDEVLVHNVVNQIQQSLFPQKRVKIINLEAGTIRINEKYLSPILFELIENALKFSEENYVVEVNAFKEDNLYKFSVKDFGRGLSRQDIESINSFKKFGENSFREKGLGLGLEIVKRISSLHNIDFKLTSELNKSTVAELNFPL